MNQTNLNAYCGRSDGQIEIKKANFFVFVYSDFKLCCTCRNKAFISPA